MQERNMLYSYAMGVDKSIYELEKQGFIIEEDDGDYMVSFPESKSEMWETFIKSKLQVEFWNEYISRDTMEIVFNFHLKEGFKRYVVRDLNNDEVLSLCEKLSDCRYESIEKMMRDNLFYNEKVFQPKAIINFLVKAKKNTYANGNAAKVNSSRLGSKDYEYEETINGKKICYHDTYFGGEKFIGSEVVYVDDKPIWAMNYNGYSVIENLSEEAMDNALRPALMMVGVDNSVLPVRGPSRFVNGEYKYAFEQSGTMENFIGVERIYKNDVLIYELHCSGGNIK